VKAARRVSLCSDATPSRAGSASGADRAAMPDWHGTSCTSRACTCALFALCAEDVCMRALQLEQHACYVEAVLGTRRGVGAAFLLALCLTKGVAAVGLVVSALSRRLHRDAAEVALVCVECIDFVLYQEFTSLVAWVKPLCTCAALTGLMLVKRDRIARATWLGMPIGDALLGVVAHARRACTRCCAQLVCPLLATCAMAHAFVQHPYWMLQGASFEHHRASFTTSLALCVLLLFASGQDRTSGSTSAAADLARTACCRALAAWRARCSRRSALYRKLKRY